MAAPYSRSSAPTATSLIVVLLVVAFVLTLALAGVLTWTLWPKPGGADGALPAGGREVLPKSAYDAEEREAIQLFKDAKDCVVNVDTVVLRRGFNRTTEVLQAGTGSGFIWDEAGHIVTNYHVIAEAIAKRLTLRVVLSDRSEWKVAIVGVAPEYDLAVLRISKDAPLKPIKVGTAKDLEVGQKCYAIGNPFGLSLTLTKGIVSALDREIESPAGSPIPGAIQTDAPINPGNSGGPLLDKDGRLIGVNTSIATASGAGGNVGIGFAVPVEIVNAAVPQLIRKGSLAKPSLGIKLVNQVLLRRAGYTEGAMIAEIEANSPAAEAELRSLTIDPRTREVVGLGDIILKIDGTTIRDNADYERLANRLKPGSQVTLTIRRDDRTFDVAIDLPAA